MSDGFVKISRQLGRQIPPSKDYLRVGDVMISFTYEEDWECVEFYYNPRKKRILIAKSEDSKHGFKINRKSNKLRAYIAVPAGLKNLGLQRGYYRPIMDSKHLYQFQSLNKEQ